MGKENNDRPLMFGCAIPLICVLKMFILVLRTKYNNYPHMPGVHK